MKGDREHQVSRAFVALASGLANGSDVVELLTDLTSHCADLLDVTSAGLLLADRNGILHVMAASSENTRQVELFQLQRDQGPCRDCYHGGTAVSVPDLQQALGRWPAFVPAAQAAGFSSVHALPMRLRNRVLGTLGLFGTGVGHLNDADLSLGQALADVASVALVQDAAAADSSLLNQQLQTALTSRVVLEQAKGILAQHGNLDMEEAFALMRSYARSRSLRLTELADAIANRTIPAQHILVRSSPRP